MGAVLTPPGPAATELEFTPFPKIARWNRDVVVTEKLDGVNAAVIVTEDGQVAAQSRTRLVSVGDDLHGFARWVASHEDELREGLGAGVHFGEWWGHGIRRGYGLEEKHFSLFNTKRWNAGAPDFRCAQCRCCHVVPELGYYDFPMAGSVTATLAVLGRNGSVAAPGFMRPEGVVIFHTAANMMFKATLEGDEKPKGQPA